MTNLEAAGILELLAQGVDPVTGEILPGDHVCCDYQVSAALGQAVRALRGCDSHPMEAKIPKAQTWIRKDGKPNAGRPWTKADNAELLRLHQSGMTAEQIAPLIQRRPRGVRNQLAALLVASEPAKERSRARMAWLEEEDEELSRLYPEMTENALARHFGRSPYAIHCRLIRLGLISNDLKKE